MNTSDTTRTLPLRQFRDNLGTTLDETKYTGARTVITRNGKYLAAVVSIDDLQTLEKLEEMNDIAAYDAAVAEDDGTRIAWADYLAKSAD